MTHHIWLCLSIPHHMLMVMLTWLTWLAWTLGFSIEFIKINAMGKFNSPSHAWWPHSPKMCDGDISHRTCCGPASFPSKMWGVGQPPHPKTHHCTLKPPVHHYTTTTTTPHPTMHLHIHLIPRGGGDVLECVGCRLYGITNCICHSYVCMALPLCHIWCLPRIPRSGDAIQVGWYLPVLSMGDWCISCTSCDWVVSYMNLNKWIDWFRWTNEWIELIDGMKAWWVNDWMSWAKLGCLCRIHTYIHVYQNQDYLLLQSERKQEKQ
jgi:hypothetical protein